MKLRKIILICVAAILLSQTNSFCQPNQSPPPGFATRLDYLKSLTNEAVIIAAYQKGLISDDEQMEALSIEVSNLHYTNLIDVEKAYRKGLIGKEEAMMLDEKIESAKENANRQNLYGKVVDQNGQPVAGVDVTGNIELKDSDNEIEAHKTQTDDKGLFQFTGLKGASLSADISKPGYEYNYRVGQIPSIGNESSPNDRTTFIIWKLRGAEPMVHVKAGGGIACDGTPTRFDLLTGKKNDDGDLIVKLTRNPLNIGFHRNNPFNWSVTFEITNGGLQDITNLYPYEAPAEGYQPVITLDFPTNKVGWIPEFQHSYYFKSKNGQAYGRIGIDVYANFQPPPTYFGAEIYANPAGSRNLEYDYRKEVGNHGLREPLK